MKSKFIYRYTQINGILRTHSCVYNVCFISFIQFLMILNKMLLRQSHTHYQSICHYVSFYVITNVFQDHWITQRVKIFFTKIHICIYTFSSYFPLSNHSYHLQLSLLDSWVCITPQYHRIYKTFYNNEKILLHMCKVIFSPPPLPSTHLIWNCEKKRISQDNQLLLLLSYSIR